MDILTTDKSQKKKRIVDLKGWFEEITQSPSTEEDKEMKSTKTVRHGGQRGVPHKSDENCR